MRSCGVFDGAELGWDGGRPWRAARLREPGLVLMRTLRRLFSICGRRMGGKVTLALR